MNDAKKIYKKNKKNFKLQSQFRHGQQVQLPDKIPAHPTLYCTLY